MFHEVGHGLGVKSTIDGSGFVKDHLKEYYSSMEEGKADILGLFFVTQLVDMGEYKDKDLMDNYVTFMAGLFRLGEDTHLAEPLIAILDQFIGREPAEFSEVA